MAVVDADDTVVPANVAARRLLAPAHHALTELVAADDRDRVGEALGDLRAGGRGHAALDVTWQAPGRPAHRLRLTLVGGADAAAPIALLAEDRTDEHVARELLRASEARVRALLDEAPDVVLRLDLHGVVVEASGASLPRFGWQPSDLVGRSAYDLVHADDLDALRVVDEARLVSDEPVAATMRARRADGTHAWVEGSGIVVRDPRSGEPTSVVVVVRDLRDRRRVQMRFEVAFDEAPTPMALVEARPGGPVWTRANRALCELVELPAEAVRALGFDLVHPADRHRIEPLTARIESRRAGSVVPVELRLRRADRSEVWTRVVATVAGSGAEAIVHLVDVTAEHELEDQLRRRALYDTLTGLPNRALLHDRLTLALAEAGRSARHVGVCFVDVDHLKEVNDQHGHAHGDLVIRATARALEATLRPGDTAARLAGDEFVVVVASLSPDVDEALTDLSGVAERILLQTRRQSPSVQVSVGAALATSQAGHDAVVAAADGALYTAKQAGRGRVRLADGIVIGG
jgi:diguanylate cyclase (GGDEF)-like protein/PAS domain S-box-containing protein